MGAALLIAAGLLLAANLDLMPGGGSAEGLSGWRLVLAVAIIFLLGALNTLGIGLYAPCLILCTLLGMSTRRSMRRSVSAIFAATYEPIEHPHIE